MPRIAEKFEFMKGRAVKVCAKTRDWKKGGASNKRVFMRFFRKTASEEKY